MMQQSPKTYGFLVLVALCLVGGVVLFRDELTDSIAGQQRRPLYPYAMPDNVKVVKGVLVPAETAQGFNVTGMTVQPEGNMINVRFTLTAATDTPAYPTLRVYVAYSNGQSTALAYEPSQYTHRATLSSESIAISVPRRGDERNITVLAGSRS